MSWCVGQKVVCVQETTSKRHKPIEVGKVYRIRSIFEYTRRNGEDCFCFRLHGVINRLSRDTGTELGYLEIRFRPLDEQDMDISIFTDILKKIEVKDKEVV